MRELLVLTNMELHTLFGWNKFRHTRDKKERQRYLLLTGVCVFLALLGIAYIVGLCFGLSYLGAGALIPAYLAFLASVILIVSGIFRVGNTLFRTHGYALLATMPLSTRAVVLSRFLKLYIEDLALTLLVLLPGLLTYGVMEGPTWYVYPIFVLLALFLPLLPLCISGFLGTAVLWLASRVKHKAAVESVLMVVLVLAIFIGAYFLGMNGEDLTLEQLANFATLVGDLIKSVYPPAVWFAEAAVGLVLPSLLLSLLLPSALTALTLTLAVRSYQGILRRRSSHHAKKDVDLHTVSQKSLLQALCRREAKRYFSSSVYVTNTIIGPILGTVAAVSLLIVGVSQLETSISAELGIDLNLRAALPMAVASIFCMMPATFTAYSMEGKQFGVIKALPIRASTLFDAKMLFWLLLITPFYLVAAVCMSIALATSLIDLLWIFLLPAAAILFTTVFGITVDLKFGKTDWENEVAVVKQSASAGIGGFGGFLVSLFTCIPLLLLKEPWSHLARAALLIAFLAATHCLRRINHRHSLCDL